MSRLSSYGLCLALALATGTSLAAYGQTSQPDEATSKPAAARTERATAPKKAESPRNSSSVRAGTRITAALESAVDASGAQPGDEVAARVTKNVKQDGRVVIHKGDRLIGQVRSVEASSNANAGSRLEVAFDRLVHGEQSSELNAVVTTILSTPAEERARATEPMMTPEPPMAAPAPRSAPARSGASASGGLVGNAASTVGSTAGGVTSTVNSTLETTARTTGRTLGGVGAGVDSASRTALGSTSSAALATPRRAIRLQAESAGQQQTATNSVLSTRQGSLRLDSGTTLQFRVAGQAEASKRKQ